MRPQNKEIYEMIPMLNQRRDLGYFYHISGPVLGNHEVTFYGAGLTKCFVLNDEELIEFVSLTNL